MKEVKKLIAYANGLYRGNKTSIYEGKTYNKAVFQSDDLEDGEFSVPEPLPLPVGTNASLKLKIITGKYPKIQLQEYEIKK
jgi:hypothetical protein